MNPILTIRRTRRLLHYLRRILTEFQLRHPNPQIRHRLRDYLKDAIFGRKPHQNVFFSSSPKYYSPGSPLMQSMDLGRRVVRQYVRSHGRRHSGMVKGRRPLALRSPRFGGGFEYVGYGGRSEYVGYGSGFERRRGFSGGRELGKDPRVGDASGKGGRGEDRRIVDDFAEIREHYATPKYPIVLAHGLMGFSELKVAGNLFPGIKYWHGITEAMVQNKIEVIITSVPASGSIEERAEKLRKDIIAKAGGKKVNIIAHSMGGLDARYMISRLLGEGNKIGAKEGEEGEDLEVASLTTIATPHRGSAVADYVVGDMSFEVDADSNPPSESPSSSPNPTDEPSESPTRPPLKRSPSSAGKFPGTEILYNFLTTLGMSTAAFSQLTRSYMRNEFNPSVPNIDTVRYFSYGASFRPRAWNAFRFPWKVMMRAGEGENDGLVSVDSSRWGSYKGTVVGVDHLDLINWTNRLRWAVWNGVGSGENFNAMAFYLDIADMLAKEGL